jgi:predicted  nucleic acid-binding Zn-ribbon protein
LQLLDDQLDELEELRGDLPIAVNDLKSLIQGLQDQIKDKEDQKAESLEKRQENEDEIERLNENLKKFKAQLYQVRNNKEYDALTKEIDHCEAEVEKLTNENAALEELVEKIKIEVEDIKPQLDTKNEELAIKEEELKKIIKANEREEAKLKDKRDKLAEKVRKPDYNTYMRIRKAKGGKGIVTLIRGACSGCHNVIPPQRQLEVKSNKRLFTCESCGRLIISPDIAEEVEKNS